VFEQWLVNDDLLKNIGFNRKSVNPPNVLLLRGVEEIHDDQQPISLARGVVLCCDFFFSDDFRQPFDGHASESVKLSYCPSCGRLQRFVDTLLQCARFPPIPMHAAQGGGG